MSNPNNEEEYIEADEVAEEIIEETNESEPMEEDDFEEIDNIPQEEEEEDVLEIDMSNNSWTYFDQHKDSVFKIATHPKLPVVMTGGGDNVAYVWTTHLQPPKSISTISGHNESVIAGDFTFDGEYLVTADMVGKVIITKSTKKGQLWKPIGEVETVEEVVWLETHPSQPVFAFGATDGSVWVYQINDGGKDIAQIMSGFSHATECTNGKFLEIDDPNTLQLVTCSEDGSVIQWNCFSGEQLYKFQGEDFKGEAPPWVSIAVDKQLHVAVVGGRDGALFVYNTNSGNATSYLRAIELTPDQDIYEASIEALDWCTKLSILAVGLVSGDLFFFDTKTWKLRRSLKFEDAITKVLFINGGPELVVSCLNGKIYKYDVREAKELFVGVGHNMGVLDFAVQENGKKLITAGDEGVSLVYKTDA